MWWQMFVVCACADIILADHTDWRIVNIDQGPVKGYRAPHGNFVFYGIPYATTPTGPNKFKPPLPPPTWNVTFEAIEKFIVCPQKISLHVSRENIVRETNDFFLNLQEDCLITNVYVPDTDKSNLPVVVYFYGGAYQLGYSNIKTAINLLNSKEIIIVDFNYRLGAHGFLCLGTEDIPGNAGMKDQVALLRWVQRNIASFGGNPNDVTITGWSAGSSSVDLFVISKLAKGLFHKVIPESGPIISSYTVQIDPIANAKIIAKNLNFDDDYTIGNLEAFFKNLEFEKLYSLTFVNETDSSTVFAPCVERYLGQEMFLDENPENILRSGDYSKVPMLYGVAEMEGMFRLPNFEEWKTMMNDNFTNFLPCNLIFQSDEERDNITQKIKHFYFGDEPVGEKNILKYVQYFGDVLFTYGTAKTVKLQVEAGNNQIYLYEYGYADENSDYIIHTQTRGATHCAQTNAVLDLEDEENLSDAYKKMKALMRNLWLNFIITGKPVPEGSPLAPWPPVGKNGTPYMFIDRELTLKKGFIQDRVLFWDEIYEKCNREPIAPYQF
ncbi:esterase FE4-like [Vanessa atalanta]|uniref:esterase FE4-like n=1 Tax=Vanessa atalanta TaxID=42275 RepID=UPI001FCE2CEF|nr:esterase FE4-like [Vanessa atalanta]